MIPKPPDLQAELDTQRRQVDVENFDLTLGEIIRMAESGELVRAPEYQRKFRWSLEDRSYLVESLYLGLPVPNLYVASNPDGTWEVVDGLQRLSTLLHYISEKSIVWKSLGVTSPLELVGLRKLLSFNGRAFSSMPTPLRLHFLKRSLRVTALSDKSDPEIRFEMFERLNKGGVTLTPQEVRACIYRGPFAEMLRDLADSEDFCALVKLQKIHRDDGTREELVLKFFAYLENHNNYDGNVREFLNAFMREQGSSDSLARRRKLFLETMSALRSVTSGPVIRRNYNLTPLNQFEAIAIGAARIIGAGKALCKPADGWLNDAQLVKYSTKGTNTTTAFRERNKRAEKLLAGAPVQ